MTKTRFTPAEAAEYLGLARQTLYQYRSSHDETAPRSYKFRGRVWYDLEDLEAYVAKAKRDTAIGVQDCAA